MSTSTQQCSHCQKILTTDMRFCSSCGTPVAHEVAQQVDPHQLSHTRFVESSENAFSATIPEGWNATGKLIRTPDAGILFQFHATDPSGKIYAEVPGRYYRFQEEAKGWLEKMVPQRYQTRPHLPATAFLEQVIVSEMRQRYSDLRVESIRDRADLAPLLAANARSNGEWIQLKHLTVASLRCTFTENGTSYRQKIYISVWHWPVTRVWQVSINSVVRAPAGQFAQYCAMLEGIIESVQPERAWIMAQRQKKMEEFQQGCQQVAGIVQAVQAVQGQRQETPMQQVAGIVQAMQGQAMPMQQGKMPAGEQGMNMQQQMMMQQAQLKRLEIMRNSNKEIFDMQQAGFQHRLAGQEQNFQAMDQIIQGYQGMRNPYSGQQYDVPIGYNNYWVNGLGQVAGSNSPYDSPGINFQRLDPM